MGLAFVIMELMNTTIDVQYVDWIFSTSWPLYLDSHRAMYIFSFFALAFRSLKADKAQESRSLIKGLSLLCVLAISTLISSPLTISLLLLGVLSVHRSTKRERIILMCLPFVVVLLEVFMASPGGGLYQINPLVEQTVYSNLGTSLFVLALFLSAVFLLTTQKNMLDASCVISLGVFINLFIALSPNLNSGSLFSYVVVLSLALVLFLGMRLNAVLPLAFSCKKQTVFFVALFVLVGQSADSIDEVIRLISLFVFMNMVVSDQNDSSETESIFRILGHISSLLIVGVVLPINIVQILIADSVLFTGWSGVIIILFASLTSLMTLRAFSFRKYDLKSEHLISFKEVAPAVTSVIFLFLNAVILYAAIEKTSVGTWPAFLVCIPSMAVMLTNLAGYHAKLDALCSRLFVTSPLSQDVKTLNVFNASAQIMTDVVSFVLMLTKIAFQGFGAIVNCLSYICHESLNWSLRNKIQFLFILLAATMSVVTGWAL